MLDDDRADVVNFSLAGCGFSFGEAALQVDEDAEFGAALGMTFETLALGGANACGFGSPTVAAPADSPNMLAVGGADVTTDSAGKLTRAPIVNALSGGGTSVVFPEPAWQKGARGTSISGRNVPDIVDPADVNGVGPSVYFLAYGWDGGSETIENAPVAGGLAELAQIAKGRLGLVAPAAFRAYEAGVAYSRDYFHGVSAVVTDPGRASRIARSRLRLSFGARNARLREARARALTLLDDVRAARSDGAAFHDYAGKAARHDCAPPEPLVTIRLRRVARLRGYASRWLMKRSFQE